MNRSDENGAHDDASSSVTQRQQPLEPKTRLPARFYKTVSVANEGDGYRVLLDGRPVKTPERNVLCVASAKLAEAIKQEWAAQETHIDPETMPLLKFANTALDGICGREALVVAANSQFIGSDAVCYRAFDPADLVEAQERAWDPLVDWAGDELGLALVVTRGVMPVVQPEATLGKAAEILARSGGLELSAIHVLATLTGSLVIALALARGRLSADEAWACAHVDEDFQIAKWGEDAEASARRAVRRKEFDAAHRLLALLG